MIFYFTATGNSLYVAKQLSKDCRSIPKVIHGDCHYRAESIGIVCPVYGHEMPAMVKRFFAKAELETDYFYLILTYGNRHGGAAELAEVYLRGIGKQADYINTIKMADNFLPAFDMEEQVATLSEKKIEEHIDKIKKDIFERKHRIQTASEEDRAVHQAYLKRQEAIPDKTWAELYTVTEECIGCGICMRVCPAGCITLKEQRAIHHPLDDAGNLVCEVCMACIHNCPKNAIRLNIPEKNENARYRNEHIHLPELVEANCQQ